MLEPTRARLRLRACLDAEFQNIARLIFDNTRNQQFQLNLQQILFLRSGVLFGPTERDQIKPIC